MSNSELIINELPSPERFVIGWIQPGNTVKVATPVTGNILVFSPETGNMVLLHAKDGKLFSGEVDVACHIKPEDIENVLSLLRKENTPTVSGFLERLIIRLGEGDQELEQWMLEHKSDIPELQTAWDEVKANQHIRNVDRTRFNFEHCKEVIDRMLA